MGLGDKDFVIVVAIILGFLVLIQAMLGNWLGAFFTAVILGTVVYSRLVRPSRPRR